MACSGQKVVLITGCSSGIGLRIAVTLAKDEKMRYKGKGALLLHFFFPHPPSNKQGLVSDEARVGVVHPEKTKTTLGWLRQKRPLRTKFTRVLCATLRSKRTDVCVKND